MKRRDFLTTAASGAVAAGALAGCSGAGPSPAASGSKRSTRVVWRLASSFPPGLDTIYGASDVLSSRVAEITGGAFTIHVSSAGEIVPALQVMDAVQNGSVQVGHTASYYYIGKNPALVFDTAVPFGLTARQQMAWLYEGGGLALMREVYADFNIIHFPGGNTGVQMGGWFRREINTPDDMKGLKMRIPGIGGKVMHRLGVAVQGRAAGEIFPALERGAIDAAEWVGPYDDEKLGFHKVAKNCYYPGWWEPGPSLSFLVNQDAWNKLPSNYQSAFTVATYEATMTMIARYDALNPGALQRLTEYGVSFRPFSESIMTAARDAAREIVEEEAADDARYARILAAWDTFRKQSTAWFGTAEQSYLRFASGVE